MATSAKALRAAGEKASIQLTKCLEIAKDEISRLRTELSPVSAKAEATQVELAETEKAFRVVTKECAMHTKEVAKLRCLYDKTLNSLKEHRKEADDVQAHFAQLTKRMALTSTWKQRFNSTESRRTQLAYQLDAMREEVRSLILGSETAATAPVGADDQKRCHGQKSCQLRLLATASRHDAVIRTILDMGYTQTRLELIEILDSVNGDLQSALSEIQNRVSMSILRSRRRGEDWPMPVDSTNAHLHSGVDPEPTSLSSSETTRSHKARSSWPMTSVMTANDNDSDDDYRYDCDDVEGDVEKNSLRRLRFETVGW